MDFTYKKTTAIKMVGTIFRAQIVYKNYKEFAI